MWVLIGEGPNDVKIPALIFPDKETALKTCKEIFAGIECSPKLRWTCRRCDYEFPEKIIKRLYKSYCGGCGVCYAAQLVEVEFGKPFVGWDLD